jgi:hypothetical protein
MDKDVPTLDSPVDELLRAGVLSPSALPGQLPHLDRFEIMQALGAGAEELSCGRGTRGPAPTWPSKAPQLREAAGHFRARFLRWSGRAQ